MKEGDSAIRLGGPTDPCGIAPRRPVKSNTRTKRHRLLCKRPASFVPDVIYSNEMSPRRDALCHAPR
jgi:hypothetical protein